MIARLAASCAIAGMLSACGGGGSGPASTPAPPPAPVPTPPPVPVNYNTAEYAASDGPVAHGALTAYNAGASGAGITVGVIDSGIATANAEFSGRISSASAAFNGTSSIEDEGGHGTAVTTVLAAARNDRATLGVAWGATILTLRTDTPGSCTGGVASDGCSHNTSAIAQALDHARTNGARVVNISLGGGSAPAQLRAAVDRATAAGVIIVVSAGNAEPGQPASAAPDPFAATLADPAISRGLVIIAASSDANGTHSSFSNGALGYETVTLTALGNAVRSQDQTGAQARYSGTSFSAPHIAGAIALMAQAFPNLTSAQIVDRLLSTAKDAGVTGDDAVYGSGVLDLAKAFAPAGATSLAGTAIPISTTDNGTASAAMGDLSGSSASQAVAIDTLGRAYRIALQRTVSQASRTAVLSGQLSAFRRTVATGRGPFALSFNIAAPIYALNAQDREQLRPRALSGMFITRLDATKTAAFGFGQGLETLTRRFGAREQSGAFLLATDARQTYGFDRNPRLAVASGWAVARGLTVHSGIESGSVPDPRGVEGWRNARYTQANVGTLWHGHSVGLGLDASALIERGTILGARLSPAFGLGAARTLFVDAYASGSPLLGWTVAATIRRGWTNAGGSNALNAHARLTSKAWSLDLSRAGFLTNNDRLAFRISQPLRVSSGGVRLLLPVAYDWTTSTTESRNQQVDLSPRGRQIDTEASWSAPFAGGWLTLNGYRRTNGGNIAWMRDELGGALRFTAGY